MSKIFKILSFLYFALNSAVLFAQQRFPQPEFDNGHVPPPTQLPFDQGIFMVYLDIFVFVVLLSLITYFILKKRSRRFVFWSTVFSVIYFGFYRHGCVCSIGAIQNVSLALLDKSYILPISVIVFFVLPLFYTLFFGRTFCAGVCLFGSLQDLVIYKPVKVSSWIQKSLGIIPYLYLSLAVLFAATGSDFIICRYDPFIGFFRFSATFGMYVFGVLILVTGIFIARPYCRFLCPYGVLLNWISRISWWHLTISPTDCIQCGLCENTCPVDAIQKPTATVKSEPQEKGTKRLLLFFILIPVFMFASGFICSSLYKPLSMVNLQVRLAQEISDEILTNTKSASQEAITFNASGISVKELFADAAVIQSKIYKGAWIMGALLGLFLATALIRSSIFKYRTIYEPDRGNCLSCGRCYKYCPVDKDRRRKEKAES
ncbi:MAG: 4Fe-4S binding protein [Bacteroidia bacterium]|nr:4Fe-4S binding protein [Bacteroidia bacterium]